MVKGLADCVGNFPVSQANYIVGLHVSPVGSVEEKKKLSIHPRPNGDTTLETGGRSVDANTEWVKITTVGLWESCRRLWCGYESRTTFWTQKNILFSKMDIKSTFPQIGVAPGQAACFVCRLGNLTFVNFLLNVRWCGRPECCGLIESATENSWDDGIGVGSLDSITGGRVFSGSGEEERVEGSPRAKGGGGVA